MKKPIIVTGLDISSSKISAVALECASGGVSTVLAYESQPSKGVFRGVVTNLDDASKSIERVLARLGARIAKRPDSIYANISGETVKGEKSRGMIPISSRGREVTNADISKCVNAAGTIRLAFDREIIHKIVLNFSIDDQPAIKNALGLYASRLLCEMYMITANLNHIHNIHKCVNNAGYDIKDVVYSGIADGESVLEDAQKEEGAILLNMGASLTERHIFHGGNLCSLDVIPVGAGDIKGGLRESAEFGNMVARVKAGAEEFVKKGGDIRSVVLIGGLAFAEEVIEILEERLSYPVRMGVVRNIRGNISSIEALCGATAIGLARYAAGQHRVKTAQAKNLAQNLSDKVAEIFNNYF